MRRAARTDANQAEIKLAFEKCGATVEVIRSLRAGCPDLCVGYQGRNFLVEVKMPKTGRLSKAQIEWRDNWRGSKPFCIRDAADVAAFIGLVRTLKQEDKHHEIHEHV